MREGVHLISNVPPEEWASFLRTFSRRHHHWSVQIETHDMMTGEKVLTREMPLQSIELDLEDEKNPRINVTVEEENKTIKHILFRPSRLVVISSHDGQKQLFQIVTVNTETTLCFNAPVRSSILSTP